MRTAFLTLSVLLLSLAGCSDAPRKTEAAPAASPVPVRTVTAETAPWPDVYEASGTVRARTAAVLAAKVMGYVREVNVQVGDRVREGQLLVTLDARDLETGVRRADAGVAEARAAVPEADNAVGAAKAQLELAQVTFRRIEDLFSKKSVSNQEFDEAAARLKAAQANHAMALARRSQLDARIQQASEERGSAEVMRGYARIAAPFTGVVTAKTAEPGTLATPGAPLLTIEREGAYRLEVPVEESRIAAIRAGQPASVSIDALGRTLDARVTEVVPAVDAASRAYTVKIDLPGVPQLRGGLFGRASFALGSRQALALPLAAVIEQGQLQSVMVVENGLARTRLVTLGRRSGDRVEALSGVTAGENLVCPVPPALADGARVEVRR